MTTNLPAIIPLADIRLMAEAFAKSRMFGVQTADQALALMLVAQAEGLHPATAMMEFDVIQGRPARKSWAMLNRFQSAGGKVDWTARTDERVAATFSHPQGGSVEVDWDMKRAKLAGLGGKDMWTKYPRQMLTARVISEGVRTVFPGAGGGFYAPEEVADFKDITPPKPKKTPTATIVDQSDTTHHGDAYDPETGEIIEATGLKERPQEGEEPSTEEGWLEWCRMAKLDIDRCTTVDAIDYWADATETTQMALVAFNRPWGEKIARLAIDKRDALRSAAA